MQVLNFYSRIFADQLKRGRKTATIRLGDKSHKYRKNQAVLVTIGYQFSPREKIFDAVIDAVEVKRVRDLSPRARQRTAFVAQLELAIRCGKPLFLHQRDAHADFLAILREHRAAIADCVVHCFTDTAEAMADYLALDCHIGITGWICDERRGAHLLPAVRQIPAERLLIETDAPYLLPRTLKPAPKDRRNEPAFLPCVLRTIAQARGEDEAALAAQSTANARRFFRLPIAAEA